MSTNFAAHRTILEVKKVSTLAKYPSECPIMNACNPQRKYFELLKLAVQAYLQIQYIEVYVLADTFAVVSLSSGNRM
jgi:hypothetical protein